MEIVLVFEGSALAMDADAALRSKGLTVRVMALPPEIGSECGFCLRVEEEQLSMALVYLKEKELVPGGLYVRLRENGHTSYQKFEDYK